MSEAAASRLLRLYQRFVEVSHNLASTLDLDDLLKKIMDVAVELVGAEEASVLLYDPHSHRLFFQTATNVESSPELQTLFVPEESIAGWVALNRQPQIVNNAQQDRRHFNEIDLRVNFNTRSLIAVPLVTRQKLIGVLEVLNKRQGIFDAEDQEIMLALAAQAAVAIENSRLFRQSNLIAEFVHELRTPMSSLFTASYLLQRPELEPEQRQRISQTIHKETQRLNELATIFLDMASLESSSTILRVSSFSLQSLFEECVHLASIESVERDIKIHIELPEHMPEIQADRDKLKQVILNLLYNAVKYNRPHGEVWLRGWSDETSFSFSVRDTGMGIPEDQMTSLFTRFFRARNVEQTITGTGLGLSIAHRIVEMHGGEINVDSKINEGTIFTVLIPQS